MHFFSTDLILRRVWFMVCIFTNKALTLSNLSTVGPSHK